MKVDIQDVGPCRKKLKIEIPPEDVDKEFEEAYEEVRKTVEVPGFRKGRAPHSVLRMRFGEYVKGEVFEKLVPPAYEKAVEDANLNVIGLPDINPPSSEMLFSIDLNFQSILDSETMSTDLLEEFENKGITLSDKADVSIENEGENWRINDNKNKYYIKKEEDRLDVYDSEIQVNEGESLIFEVVVNVKPEIVIPDYSQLEVEKGDVNVTKEDVDNYLEQLREKRAEYVPMEDRPIQKGDHANVSIRIMLGDEVLDDQKEQIIEVKADNLIPEFFQNLVGMSPGEEKDFSDKLPEDYPNKKIAGKEVNFHVVLNKVTEKHLPPLDDDFAKDQGEEDLQHLTAKLWNQLVDLRRYIQREKQKQDILDQLLEKSQFEVSDPLLKEQVKTMLRGRKDEVSEEEISQYKSSASDSIKKAWIMEEIEKREEITVSEEEVEDKVKEIAESKNRDPQKYMSLLKAANRLDDVANSLIEEKIFDFLIENASEKRTLIV